ncbi:hypothetical protein E2C01_058554 [Portunus trituberculatus]|uniref:Uncharacterized protein n=1 Tax=Portunus trituberculatus TaxID=210409 RepID=A0A5B7H3A5_PORTR|nr:hypothetical protein [Portunus trituberculatus]
MVVVVVVAAAAEGGNALLLVVVVALACCWLDGWLGRLTAAAHSETRPAFILVTTAALVPPSPP